MTVRQYIHIIKLPPTLLPVLKTASFFLLFYLLFCSCHGDSGKVPAGTPAFDSIITRATHLGDSGNKDQSIKLIQTAYYNNKDLNITDQLDYLVFCNTAYVKMRRYDKSLELADSMTSAIERSRYADQLADRKIMAYNIKADALFAMGLYNEAYDNYYKAQKLAKDNLDTCALSGYSYSLGMALYKQQRFKEAAAHFIAASNTSSLCKDDFSNFYFRQEVLDNVGLCYVNAKVYDSAKIYFDMALKYIDDNFNRFPHEQASMYLTAQAVVYGNIATLYVAQGKTDSAEQLYKNSINANLQKGYTNSDAVVDQVKLANLYYTRNQIPEMKAVLDQIKAETDSVPDQQVQTSWNKLMWYYYAREKDSVKAYRHLSAYVAMNDSFLSKNKAMMEIDVDGKIKSVGRQYQIELLNKDNEKNKIYLIVTLLVLVMAIVIIILILMNARRSVNNIKKLTDLNNKVNDQKAKLEVALTELEFKDRDKSRILRSVAHDVMNPISAIVALSDILIEESANFTDEQKEILSLVKEACTNSLSLSRDILEAAVEIDTANMAKEWTNITKLVTNSADLLNIRAQAKNQQITVTSSIGNMEAFVNKDKIWRVVNNLITNAIKFSHLNSEIKIAIQSMDGKIKVSVKDNGVGIPEKNKHNIFDMFTESKLPGTAGETPHGMGLSISLQIAKAHKGNVWFDSEEGKGSTFYLEFPVN